MPLVERLRHLQRAAGRESEALVRLTLKGGEVVEKGRGLRGGLLLLFNNAGFAGASGDDRFGVFATPDAFGARILVRAFLERLGEPASAVFAGCNGEIGEDFEVRAGLESPDLDLAINEDGEGGRLDATGGCLLETAADELVVE